MLKVQRLLLENTAAMLLCSPSGSFSSKRDKLGRRSTWDPDLSRAYLPKMEGGGIWMRGSSHGF